MRAETEEQRFRREHAFRSRTPLFKGYQTQHFRTETILSIDSDDQMLESDDRMLLPRHQPGQPAGQTEDLAIVAYNNTLREKYEICNAAIKTLQAELAKRKHAVFEPVSYNHPAVEAERALADLVKSIKTFPKIQTQAVDKAAKATLVKVIHNIYIARIAQAEDLMVKLRKILGQDETYQKHLVQLDHFREEEEAETQQQLQQQRQLQQREDELIEMEEFVRQNATDIEAVAKSIGMLALLFKDVHVMIADQGAVLNSIEANITEVVQSTGDAHTNLAAADRYQKSYNNKCSCFLVILLVIVAVIILGFFIQKLVTK
jgi:hypothetical protein